jgi:simple sugar transport system permease protein
VSRSLAAIALSFGCAAVLLVVAGADSAMAARALMEGAFGSADRIAFALNKATPYILCAVGVSLCFRASVITIGAEGQIALGGLCAAWFALKVPSASPLITVSLSCACGILGGLCWAGLAALIHVSRGVSEVLVTLLMNFIAWLIVSQALNGGLGEQGAGFPQSPLLAQEAWLPSIWPGTELHIGILLALAAAVMGHLLLWHGSWGFALRVAGESRRAAQYAGFSTALDRVKVMMLAGGLAGLAGAIEVLGVHYRLIDGFSKGFGYNAIAVALLAALNPLAVIPAGLFFAFLEAGTLGMQRKIGVSSSLVIVMQGMIVLFVLAGAARAAGRSRR